MKSIVVCMKAVITSPAGSAQARTEANTAANPFDLAALEMALSVSQETGAAVTALTMGPESAVHVLHTALAMGADRGVLVCDPGCAGSDTLATSRVIAAAVSCMGPVDLLLFGVRSTDSDTGQVGPETAVLAGFGFVGRVLSIEAQADGLVLRGRLDGFEHVYRARPPVAATVHPDAARPRDVGLSGIREAFSTRPVQTLCLADLGLDPVCLGDGGSPTVVLSTRRAEKSGGCTFLTGTPEARAEALVARLREKGLIG